MWLREVVAIPAVGVMGACGACAAEPVSLAGVWKGESVCASAAASCTDEAVVYYLEDVPGKPDQVLVQADKIVAGAAVPMGKGVWTRNRTRGTLEWEAGGRVWRLNVDGDRMEGTLTLPNNTSFRKMTLRKLS
jgi:hypothetical protein